MGGDGDDALVAVQQLEHIVEDGFPVAVAADQVGLHELGRFLGESLRVAAGEDGDGAGVLALGPAEPLAALLVAEVGHGAAVDHKDVGLFAFRHDGEAGPPEHLFQGPGLVQVDFAAKGIKTNSHEGISFLWGTKPSQSRFARQLPQSGSLWHTGKAVLFAWA